MLWKTVNPGFVLKVFRYLRFLIVLKTALIEILKQAATFLYVWPPKTAPKMTSERLGDKILSDKRPAVQSIISLYFFEENTKTYWCLKIRGKKSKGAKSILPGKNEHFVSVEIMNNCSSLRCRRRT